MITTTVQPSPTCQMCKAGMRRYHQTIYSPSRSLTERLHVHFTQPGQFEVCEDQAEYVKVIR